MLAARLGRTVTKLAIEDDHSGLCEADPPTYARTGPNARRAQREDMLICLAGDIAEQQPGEVMRWWRL